MIVNKYNKSGGGSPFDPTQYYTKPEVDAEISGATEGLASEDYVDAAITAGTQDFVTEDYVDAAITSATQDLATEAYVDAAITAHTPDLSNYYTKVEVDTAITSATEDFVTEAEVTAITSPIQTQLDDVERVTATALTELHNDILEISGSTPDLSNYYTKAETDAEITGATEDLATENYVDAAITAGTQGFATEDYVDAAITSATQDLATEAYVDAAITAHTPDLSNYYTKAQINDKEEVVASALTELHNQVLDISGNTPDLTNYYTKAEVDAEITGATQGYATEAYVTGATSGLASQSYVTSAITTATAHMVESSDDTIQNIVKITQAGYDALVQGGTVDPYTFYVIIN